MTTDALAPCIAKSAATVLTWDKWVTVFQEGEYELLAASQCWEMIGNITAFLNFQKLIHASPGHQWSYHAELVPLNIPISTDGNITGQCDQLVCHFTTRAINKWFMLVTTEDTVDKHNYFRQLRISGGCYPNYCWWWNKTILSTTPTVFHHNCNCTKKKPNR